MVPPWHIYHVNECRHTTPRKPKYVAIVCLNPNPYGFLINSEISRFIKHSPALLSSQVAITAERYGFLKHDSYINCGQLYSFRSGELHSVQDVQNNTRKAIQRIVANSTLIEPVYRRLICGK
jgi:hypothetical protein